MFGKLYNYNEPNYRLFCYKGSVHKFKFEFSICDVCETGSSNISTRSEAVELDRVVGAILCQAQEHIKVTNAIKTASFLIKIAEKPWKIGRKVGFRLRGKVLATHNAMFILKVQSKHRKQHAAKTFLMETESQSNLSNVRDEPQPHTSGVIRTVPAQNVQGDPRPQISKFVRGVHVQKQDGPPQSQNSRETVEGQLDRLQKDDKKKLKTTRELPTTHKQSPKKSKREISRSPVHTLSSDSHLLEASSPDEMLPWCLRTTPQRAAAKDSTSPRLGIPASSPLKRPLLAKDHKTCSNTSSPQKSPRRSAKNHHSPAKFSAGSDEPRQTRSNSTLTGDERSLVHPRGREFVRREYEKEETRLRNMAKPVTSSSERESLLKSV